MGKQFFVKGVVSLVILLPMISEIVIADLESDREGLLNFAASVDHFRKLNWDLGVAVCSSWVGITCDKEGTRVIAVHLPGKGLGGPIPANSIGKLDGLRVVSLRSNHLNGTLPSDILSIPSLQSLYLKHNNFSGDISPALNPQLGVLDLSFNSFTGEIPSRINNLKRLSVLNLQFNSFSGNIPNLNLPRLESLNLSYNILNGTIPQSLRKFPIYSFVGNSHLCGSPLSYCSEMPSSSHLAISEAQNAPYSKKLQEGAIIAISIGGSSILLLLVSVMLFYCWKKNVSDGSGFEKKACENGNNDKSEEFGAAEKNKLVFFEGCSYSFDLEDLLRASAEVLGKGSYGATYKAVLDEGTMFALKRLNAVWVGKKEFEQQMEIVAKVWQHPSVVPLHAYYYSKDEKLLVYVYMPAGSLAAALHGNRGIGRRTLDWDTRMKILLGAARGIAHIHSEGGLRLTHGNIKSSNVLLTRNHDGCISEFGLATLINDFPEKCSEVGYLAREVIKTGKINQKSDVYSFGVVILEVLTGKPPLQSSGDENVVYLPKWVQSVVQEEWSAEVFDVELMDYMDVGEEMVQMLQIALACVTKLPQNRPTMDEVVRMIEETWHFNLDNRASSKDIRSKDSTVHTLD